MVCQTLRTGTQTLRTGTQTLGMTRRVCLLAEQQDFFQAYKFYIPMICSLLTYTGLEIAGFSRLESSTKLPLWKDLEVF